MFYDLKKPRKFKVKITDLETGESVLYKEVIDFQFSINNDSEDGFTPYGIGPCTYSKGVFINMSGYVPNKNLEKDKKEAFELYERHKLGQALVDKKCDFCKKDAVNCVDMYTPGTFHCKAHKKKADKIYKDFWKRRREELMEE